MHSFTSNRQRKRRGMAVIRWVKIRVFFKVGSQKLKYNKIGENYVKQHDVVLKLWCYFNVLLVWLQCGIARILEGGGGPPLASWKKVKKVCNSLYWQPSKRRNVNDYDKLLILAIRLGLAKLKVCWVLLDSY